jgi:hypothetical protein
MHNYDRFSISKFRGAKKLLDKFGSKEAAMDAVRKSYKGSN